MKTDRTAFSRNDTMRAIRKALKRRSDRTWSVTGGRGTSWGWIKIMSPPARRLEFGYMSEDDMTELGRLMGKAHVHIQGESIPASVDYYSEYIDRAEGRAPSVVGQRYWD